MVDYIYGRNHDLTNDTRPHVFIAELRLYINFLAEQVAKDAGSLVDAKRKKYLNEFYKNMESGIAYYRQLEGVTQRFKAQFDAALDKASEDLARLQCQFSLN